MSFLPPRSELPQQHPADSTFSAVSFKPGFHQDDIQMMVWKRLLRRVLPGRMALGVGGLVHTEAEGGVGQLPYNQPEYGGYGCY